MDPQVSPNPAPPVEPQPPAQSVPQPTEVPPTSPQPMAPTPVNNQPIGLGIAALILAIFIPIIGFILAVIGLIKSRGNSTLKVLSIMAICISLLIGPLESWLVYSGYKGWQRAQQDVVVVSSNSTAMINYTITDDAGAGLAQLSYPAKTTDNSIKIVGRPTPDNEKGVQLERAIKKSDGFYSLTILATSVDKNASATTAGVTSTEDWQKLLAKDPKANANILTTNDVSFAVATATLIDYHGQKAVLLEASQGKPISKDPVFGDTKTGGGFSPSDSVRLKALFIVKGNRIYSLQIAATTSEWITDATVLSKTYDSLKLL